MVRPDGVAVAELVVPSFGYKNHVDADQRTASSGAIGDARRGQ